ncbi:MAG TPA: hypothetical protein VMT89_08100, partial [Candidatus Acidoferrales bacterium]|nr:hypothetical protein [Candidatus Acidoferrales bacterium]
ASGLLARVEAAGARSSEPPVDDASSERARLNVVRAVTAAMRRIKTHHPQLWAHLSRTLRVGVRCTYTPDMSVPIQWET